RKAVHRPDVLDPTPFRLLANPRCGVPGDDVLPDAGFREAKNAITRWADYAATPLHDLPALAHSMHVGAVRLKDEATRFNLGSFKALGGAYAVALAAADAGDKALTVACATDGNHGRAVAWGAQRFGCRCVIFVHEGVSQRRVNAIARYGADVRRVTGTYDDSVREVARQAAANGWQVVSDTSWDGYTDVP